jgi:Spy/CpxP family protein refolding chaperone
MYYTPRRMIGLALLLTLSLVASVAAQQQEHQQHHPGSPETLQAQPGGSGTAGPEQAQSGEQLQGMMEHMQGMMEHMQSMMERMQHRMGSAGMRGMGGMTGGRGMMGQEREGEAPAPHGSGGMLRHHLQQLTQQLSLTDSQRAQVQTLLSGHIKEVIRLRADIGVMGVDVLQLLEADPVDLPKVKQLLQTIASRQADMRFSHITLMQEISKLLTPEQQQKFRTLRDRLLAGHGGMMGHADMMGRGGMPGHGGMMGRQPQGQ